MCTAAASSVLPHRAPSQVTHSPSHRPLNTRVEQCQRGLRDRFRITAPTAAPLSLVLSCRPAAPLSLVLSYRPAVTLSLVLSYRPAVTHSLVLSYRPTYSPLLLIPGPPHEATDNSSTVWTSAPMTALPHRVAFRPSLSLPCRLVQSNPASRLFPSTMWKYPHQPLIVCLAPATTSPPLPHHPPLSLCPYLPLT